MQHDFAINILERTVFLGYIVSTETDGCRLFAVQAADLFSQVEYPLTSSEHE